jgi:ABC-2 type transport system ATP-binding protein
MNELTIIEAVNLTKRYGAFRAIDSVSFSVKKGEIVGFVGLNGAGKSTTINLLLGFLRATNGSVRLFGKSISPETAHTTHRDIGFASGDMALFDNLSGKQYLTFLSHRYRLRDQTRVNELCARFEPQLDKKIKDLSRGNRQKIALIGAFMASPKLVILDEPSSGLDPLMQQAFLDLVREEGDRGTTIFMSSHYLGEVAVVCSRVLLLRKGKLVKDILAHQLEAAGGKMVHTAAKYAVVPPKDARLVTHRKTAEGHEVDFVYKGSTLNLQKWLASAPPLNELTITEHDLEAAFSDLYVKDAAEESHV